MIPSALFLYLSDPLFYNRVTPSKTAPKGGDDDIQPVGGKTSAPYFSRPQAEELRKSDSYINAQFRG